MKRLIVATAIAVSLPALSAAPAAAAPTAVTVSQIVCPHTYKPMWVSAGTSGDKNANNAVCFKAKRYVDDLMVFTITVWLDSEGCVAPYFAVTGAIKPDVDANRNGVVCFDPNARKQWVDDVATFAGLG